MADLISREAAIECAINAVDDWDGGWNPNRETVIRRYFEELPAVDAVPVVRCKNCKFWEEQPSDGKMGGFGICSNLGGGWDGNEFCSDAERRDEDAPDRR